MKKHNDSFTKLKNQEYTGYTEGFRRFYKQAKKCIK